MTEEIRLSKRLFHVAQYLPKGANFADIGSDHAYLPCYVCQHDPDARAIAGEVNEGPLLSAKETISKYQLNDVVEARLGDGLAVLEEDEVEQVVIAGMGGALIRSILENGKDKLGSVDTIITQPNVDEKNVRQWFMENGFQIIHEVILEENGHIYEIVVAKVINGIYQLSEQELLFGPILLQERNALFHEKWKSEQKKIEKIIKQMENAQNVNTAKIATFKKQLAWIEEVLQDGKND